MIKAVAFFGLGAMGTPMAENLLKAGYEVSTAIHNSRAAADDLAQRCGLNICESVSAAAQQADAVITILPADPEVKSFLINESFAASLKRGCVIIDMSSCTTAAIQEVEAFYAPYGVSVVDAPVSGGVDGAEAGTLSIFAAGKSDALALARPLLEVMGREVFDLGSCGNGKAFKNLNNLLSTANVVIITEMYHIAKKRGYDTDRLFEVIMASSGASVSFKNRFKRMVNQQFEGGFKQSLARKDVGNAIALGDDVPTPVAKLVYELMLANKQYDEMDMSVMCRLFED